MIDLRSDTVTRPSPAMRQAMADAEVGDDVFGEDPTVVRLQERIAELLGKEAALFVPSGSMANQLALRVHTAPGDEVICEADAHIVHYESGAAGALSGVQLRPVQGHRGMLTAGQVREAIRHGYYWEPQSRLVCLENTANKAGGCVLPQATVLEVAAAARERGLSLHLDGARLWNAAAALGTTERSLAAPFDTVSVCLSKGLGAPIGSLIAGPAELIEKAHRWRKVFGGGMRQVGVIAAAGLYAVEKHRTDLAEDHRRAKALAAGLQGLPGVTIDRDDVDTNIVMFDVADAFDALEKLKAHDVLMVPFSPTRIRATTHRDVGDRDIHDALLAARAVFKA
ncbi:MAG: DegT/DnrJ/EryC1/StrS family aminotransferase [Rhodothermales bacterium]|nr:DegT/DnrJ/EryC1/StrS family aminotransferase [Rhodothermales bacterium]